MDTITHALVGAAISDGFFRRRLGPAATPFALVVGALPDIDMLSFLVSSEYMWAHHRGYTHALPVIVLASPLLGLIGRGIGKMTRTWIYWSLLSLLCLLSHTLLDIATSWGTMPFLPFSNARVSLDIAPIIDLFITSAALASFVVNRLLRWERVDVPLNPVDYPVVHEHPKRRRAGDVIGKVAVFLIVAYLAVGFLQNRQTVRLATRQLEAAGFKPVEVRAVPIMFTYVAWGIVARDAGGEIRAAFHSTWAPKPMVFHSFATGRSATVDAALSSTAGKLFSWYSQGMFTAEERDLPDGSEVLLKDRRFAVPTEPSAVRFVMRFRLDRDRRVLSSEVVRLDAWNFDLRKEFDLLWRLTRYGETGDGGR